MHLNLSAPEKSTQWRSLSASFDLYIGKASPQNQFTLGGESVLPHRQQEGTQSLARLFALGLIILPIIEIALFIKVGQTIGLFPTLALIIGAAILGGLLLRQQGLSVLTQLRSNVSTGRMPGRTIADAMMLGVAALFLVLPGFLSDVVALALLLPPVRGWIYATLASRVTVVESTTSYRRHDPASGRIEGAIDLDEDDYRPR
jgi:UPF0716 protein FxsA